MERVYIPLNNRTEDESTKELPLEQRYLNAANELVGAFERCIKEDALEWGRVALYMCTLRDIRNALQQEQEQGQQECGLQLELVTAERR